MKLSLSLRTMSRVLLSSIVLISIKANADFGRNYDLPYRTAYSPNFRLKEQLESQQNADGSPRRVLPSSDHYSLAIDAEFFKPVQLGNEISDDNYAFNQWHGNGYWVDNRIELRPLDQIRLNLKLTAYQGSSSGGPSSFGSRILTRVGVDFEDQIGESEWTVYGRANDLGRQTIGRGLIVEDRETDGFQGGFKNGDWQILGTVDGTGGVWLEGEATSVQVLWRDGLAGLTATSYTEDPGMGQALDEIGWVTSLVSSHPIALEDRLRYDAEVALNRGNVGLLAGLRYDYQGVEWSFNVHPQFRRYFAGFAAGAAGQTQPVFSAYDQFDLSFTNFQNIFFYGSDSSVYAVRATVGFRPAHWIGFSTDHELGKFLYASVDDVAFHFFTTGVDLYPLRAREDSIFLYVSNKWFNGVPATPAGNPVSITPETLDVFPRPMFVDALYIGFTAKMKF